MTSIAIVPEGQGAVPTRYRAVAGQRHSVGATAGEALDALTAQMGEPAETTLIVFQPMRPDALFTAEQQRRLAELMTRWRAARDADTTLTPEEQAELQTLVDAEVQAAAQRSAALVRQLPS